MTIYHDHNSYIISTRLYIAHGNTFFFTMDTIAEVEDHLAKPVTQVFAFIGILYVCLKIFSFWRLIASLFVLPGKSVSHIIDIWLCSC